MGFPLIINIEGNIGTGKSTILQKLQDELEIHHKDKVFHDYKYVFSSKRNEF